MEYVKFIEKIYNKFITYNFNNIDKIYLMKDLLNHMIFMLIIKEKLHINLNCLWTKENIYRYFYYPLQYSDYNCFDSQIR